jgi:hypothetical protein
MSKIFNGSTDLIDLGSPAALDDIGGSPGSKSIVAWIYPTGWGEVTVGRIWNKQSDAGTDGWMLHVTDANTDASFKLQLGGGTLGRATAVAGTLSLNKWWCVAGTYTPGDGGPRLWVGSLTAPMAEVASYSGAAGDNRQDVATYGSDAALNAYLGNRAAADRTFAGRITQVSVWDNRLVLGQLERLRLDARAWRHAFATAAGVPIVCKGYWPTGESDAATCLDYSGNHSTGTVTGTTVGPDPLPLVRSQALRVARGAAGATFTHPGDFPRIAATAASATPADATSHVCALPEGIAVGDLLLAAVVCDGDAAMTWPAGWTAIENGAGASGTAVRSELRYRTAEGGEGASITITGASESWVSRTWRITGARAGSTPQCAAANGIFADANPPPLTPSWGHKNALWLFHVAWDGLPAFDFWPSWWPRNVRIAAHVNTSGGGAAEVKQASTSFYLSSPRQSLDPPALTSEAAAWRALTIAIEPAYVEDPAIARRQEEYGVDA